MRGFTISVFGFIALLLAFMYDMHPLWYVAGLAALIGGYFVVRSGFQSDKEDENRREQNTCPKCDRPALTYFQGLKRMTQDDMKTAYAR